MGLIQTIADLNSVKRQSKRKCMLPDSMIDLFHISGFLSLFLSLSVQLSLWYFVLKISALVSALSTWSLLFSSTWLPPPAPESRNSHKAGSWGNGRTYVLCLLLLRIISLCLMSNVMKTLLLMFCLFSFSCVRTNPVLNYFIMAESKSPYGRIWNWIASKL